MIAMQVTPPTPMDMARFLDVEAIVNEDREDDDFESEDNYGAGHQVTTTFVQPPNRLDENFFGDTPFLTKLWLV